MHRPFNICNHVSYVIIIETWLTASDDKWIIKHIFVYKEYTYIKLYYEKTNIIDLCGSHARSLYRSAERGRSRS